MAFRPAILHRDVAARDVTSRAESLMEGFDVPFPFVERGQADKADDRRRLLCVRCERPRCRSACERRDELPPPHSITSSAVNSKRDGTSRPSAFAVFRLMINSNLFGC